MRSNKKKKKKHWFGIVVSSHNSSVYLFVYLYHVLCTVYCGKVVCRRAKFDSQFLAVIALLISPDYIIQYIQ